jgi:hypothetical protein
VPSAFAERVRRVYQPGAPCPVVGIAIDLAEANAAFKRLLSLVGLMDAAGITSAAPSTALATLQLHIDAAQASAKIHALRLQAICEAHGAWINEQITSGIATHEHGPQFAQRLTAAFGTDDQDYASHWATSLGSFAGGAAEAVSTACEIIAYQLLAETIACGLGHVIECALIPHTLEHGTLLHC